MKRPRERSGIWPAPITLGALSALGLLAALLSDDIGDVIAWLALAAPACIVMWFAMRRG